jgi:hypothetical protein
MRSRRSAMTLGTTRRRRNGNADGPSETFAGARIESFFN